MSGMARQAENQPHRSDQPLRFMSGARSRVPMHRYLARWLPTVGTFLDVGCGSGDLVRLAGEQGLVAFGLDRNEAALRVGGSGGLRLAVGDVLAPPFASAAPFDVITMEHLIEHFDPEDAYRLVSLYSELLLPGGRLILVTPNYADWTVVSEIFWLDTTHRRPYPLRLLEAMVTDVGLRVEHVSTQRLVRLGIRAAIRRPLGVLRFGREFQRMNLVLVASKPI